MGRVYRWLLLFGLGSVALPVFAGCGPSLAQLRLTAAVVTASGANAKMDGQAQAPQLFSFELSSAPIVGLWNIKFTSGNQVVDEGFDAWHGDGTETLNDTPPPVTGNVCLGAWTQTGRNTFKLKHPSWVYDEATNTQVIGQAIIRETVSVSRDGNSFSGSFTVDVIDTFGNSLAHFEGQVRATRIKPD
jgi:hypothetical protein